jgi:hypothetical protein
VRARRPRSIRLFEALFCVGLAAIVLNGYAIASNPDAAVVLRTESPEFAVAVQLVIGLAFNLLLLWLIAYRASNVGRWLFVGLVCVGALSDVLGLEDIRRLGDLSFGLALLQNVFCAVEIFLLFRRDARDWFAGRVPIDPEIFR